MDTLNSLLDSINIADALVVILILVFGIIGLTNGFVYSVFKIAAFFVSIFIAIKFYPVAADLLTKFGLRDSIEGSVTEGLLRQRDLLFPGAAEGAQQGSSFLDNMQIPNFLKDTISNSNLDMGQIIDFKAFAASAGASLAQLLVDVLALILLFILARIALSLLKAVLSGLAKLPVFKQIDKAGGFAFGVIEGIFMIYIICTVLLLFSSSQMLVPAFKEISESKIANFFYEKKYYSRFPVSETAIN
jgi:uncharacterized membrane protein required for colicin V production